MWICPKCNKPVADHKENCPFCNETRPFKVTRTHEIGFDGTTNKFFEVAIIFYFLANLIYTICYFATPQIPGGVFYLVATIISLLIFVLKYFVSRKIYMFAAVILSLIDFIAACNAFFQAPAYFDTACWWLLMLIALLASISALILNLKENYKWSKICYCVVGPAIAISHFFNFINVIVTLYQIPEGGLYEWYIAFMIIAQILFVIYGVLYLLHTITAFRHFAIEKHIPIKEIK